MDNAQPCARLDPREARLAPATHGDMAFATADERDAATLRLARAGWIVAELEGIGPSARGRLGEVINETIERELASRAVGGPGADGLTDAPHRPDAEHRDATLSDQLFRARRAGATGLAIVLGPLRAATGALGALEPADSATLRFLALATRDRPFTMLLDARDTSTAGYRDPVELRELLSPSAPAPSPALAPAPPSGRSPVAAATSAVTASAATAAADRRAATDDPWLAWTVQLADARGPQPLSALERLFAQAYMPLANAIAGGLDDPHAVRARDEFREAFASGYHESFPTFAATTKRPRMVLDVHDTAVRIARLHGARTVRVLLIDSMRWDLTRTIEERLIARLGSRAALTDELVLWSALPTTTLRQLETVARGIEALRAPGTLDGEAEPPRGRNAEHVRRIRVGPRELHKLDLVESRVQAARTDVLRALPDIADAAAEVVARHVETLAPRTLLFVFGDHGFVIDRTGAARQGGASPEEVLVGAFSLLVGDVH